MPKKRRPPSAHLVRRVLALAHPVQFHRRAVPGENLSKQTQTATEINTDEEWPQKQDEGPTGFAYGALGSGRDGDPALRGQLGAEDLRGAGYEAHSEGRVGEHLHTQLALRS
jgi:hypothetical protein